MNSQRLKIYTLLTHPTAREDYHISDDGTKLWTLVDGDLAGFEGEGLDKMSPAALYYFYREKLTEYHTNLWTQ